MGGLLEISLARFLAKKVLARDVFLQMPKNGKNLRIASAGDEIRPELLQRLKERGVTHLLASRLSANDEPATCRLYEVDAPLAPNGQSMSIQEDIQPSEHPQPDGGQIISANRETDFGHPEPVIESEIISSAQEAAGLPQTHPTQQQHLRLPLGDEADNTGYILTKDSSVLSHESASLDHGQAETNERIDGPLNPLDPEQKFSPADTEPEFARTVSGGQAVESLSRIAGKKDTKGGEEIENFASAVDSEQDVNSFESLERLSNEKNSTGGNIMDSLARLASRKPVTTTEKPADTSASRRAEEVIISSLRNTLEEIVQVVSGEADVRAEEPVQVLKTELELCINTLAATRDNPIEKVVIAVEANLAQAVKTFNESSGSAAAESGLAPDISEAIENARRRFTDAAAKLAKAQSFTGNSEEEFEKRFEAETITTPDKEELHRDRAGPQAEDLPEFWRDRPEKPPSDRAETFRGSADHSVPLSENVFASDSNLTELESRIRELNSGSGERQYSENSRAAIYKELPATAGRMAALLAHSIGYANPTYLSDLAFATMAYFFRKEGRSIAGTSLPSLTQAVLEARNSDIDGSVSDSLEIIRLLESYFENPDCDRSSKEFSRRVFRESLEGLRGRPIGLNRWNEARWSQFVEKGPSIDAQSLCGKASARAVKLARQLSP